VRLPRRLLIAFAVLLLAAVGYEFWIAYQTSRDLQSARDAVTRFQDAVDVDDDGARDDALAELEDAASSARGRTDGPWWGVTTVLPFVGDDTEAVRALAESLDVLASEGAPPLVEALDQVDDVSTDGQVDLEVVRGLGEQVSTARSALDRAADLVDLDSGGYVDALRTRFDEYVTKIDDLASAMRAADTAVEVMPAMLGGDEPRRYLLAFQNNAEVRASGGLPGSWALVSADEGRLEIVEQGAGSGFPVGARPILEQSPEETKIYGPELGRYFLDANFTPDFPRTGELMRAHWDASHPDDPIDGVLSMDTVALSYLLDGTGPVPVDDLSLTSENAVPELLNGIYLREENPAEQDAFFERATKSIFDAVTGDLASPTSFVEGIGRAAREGRMLIAPFDADDAAALAGTKVLGSTDETDETDEQPRIDVTFNDATGSKMSYYLRYENRAMVTSCAGDEMAIEGAVNLRQTMSAGELAKLPDYVTGGGAFGTDAGNQFVFVRLFGPEGSTFENVTIAGKKADDLEPVVLDGRPVVSLYLLISSTEDTLVNYSISAPRATTPDSLLVHTTPSVVPGPADRVLERPCS